MSFFKEFRDFAMRGNVIDLAVGVIIGAAFGKIVSSLVEDVIMPPLGLLMGQVDFADKFLILKGEGEFPTVAAAKAAGVVTLNYGIFINTIVQFTIVSFAIFVVIKQINRLKKAEEQKPQTPPSPPRSEILLEEIRDLLRKQ